MSQDLPVKTTTRRRAFLKNAAAVFGVAALFGGIASPVLATDGEKKKKAKAKPKTVAAADKAASPAAAKKLILAKLPIKSGTENRKAFMKAARAVVAGTRAEPGNLGYELFLATARDKSASGPTYLMVEHWRDDAAIQAHFETSHFKEFMKTYGEVGGKATLVTYDIAAVKEG